MYPRDLLTNTQTVHVFVSYSLWTYLAQVFIHNYASKGCNITRFSSCLFLFRWCYMS